METISAKDLLAIDMPTATYMWGDLLRIGSRICLIGQPKTAKSFFVIELGLSIAAGKEFLGMETKKSTVVYVNFEISQEMLQERLQDTISEMGIDPPQNFIAASVGNIALEKPVGHQALEEILIEAGIDIGVADLLILDPRRNSMEGDENQSEILTAWAANVDSLRKEFGFTTVVVHHAGKNTIGMGRGSSVFDGWVDGSMTIRKQELREQSDESESRTSLSTAILEVVSRDSESRDISLEFNYPTWKLASQQLVVERTKAKKCQDFIEQKLQEKSPWELVKLRTEAFRVHHTDYAIKRAIKTLESQKIIRMTKDTSKQGNYKLVELLPHKAGT
jgi:RecA-family ATPase